MTEKTYFLRDAKDLDLQFYRSYDEAFLFRKAETLMRLVDDVEKYKTAVLEEDGENFDQKKFVETLNAEIHFAEFHQFEAFFAVLIAVFQNLPHWILRTSQAVSHALSFFWLDGFAVPAPAQVTQTVGQPRAIHKEIFSNT